MDWEGEEAEKLKVEKSKKKNFNTESTEGKARRAQRREKEPIWKAATTREREKTREEKEISTP